MKKIILGIATTLIALTLPAQVTPTRITSGFTNGTPILIPATITFAGVTNPPVDIYQGKTLGFYISAVATNAGVSNVIVAIEFTPDRTNYVASPIALVPFQLTGTTPYKLETNFPAALVDNFLAARIKYATNGSVGNIWISNAWFIRH